MPLTVYGLIMVKMKMNFKRYCSEVLNNPARALRPLKYRFAQSKYVSDRTALKFMYECMVGRKLNLDNPKSFNEKLQWLKLHDRNPLYTTLVDKVRVKDWVEERLGKAFVVPTYGIWNTPDEINLNDLPDTFVLKVNHDSGGVLICNSKNDFDFEDAKLKLSRSLETDFYYWGREWPYKNVQRLIFAEELIDFPQSTGVIDYKFMCFNGRVECAFTCVGRELGDLRVDFFDREWNHLPFTRHYHNADCTPKRPPNLDLMIELAQVLSLGIPFVRVDFYDLQDRVLFGEMTFYPGAGFEEFEPYEWDLYLGSLIDLTKAYSDG